MDPIKLFNAALASCAAFYAMTFLSRRITNLKGLKIESIWDYYENPHRIGEISLTIKLPRKLSEDERKGLLGTVEYCTIKNTLEHPPDRSICNRRLIYQG